MAAGSGRLDLDRQALAEMTYTKVAFEQEKIGIGVVPYLCETETFSVCMENVQCHRKLNYGMAAAAERPGWRSMPERTMYPCL